MYRINNIPLSNFGIIPGKLDDSNIAVAGILDMPARIGKTFHDWTGEAGVEPYVLPSEIRFGARTIGFTGFIVDDHATALLQSFYREIDTWTALVPFQTPWSEHMVYIKKRIEAENPKHNFIRIRMEFEEPVCTVPNYPVTGIDTGIPNIDGVSFQSLNLILTGFNDRFNRPEIKDQQFTAYETEGYQITPSQSLRFEMELAMYGNGYEELQSKIEQLHAIMAAPGIRSVSTGRDSFQAFCPEGFNVTRILIAPNYGLAKIRLKLMTTSASGASALILKELLDNQEAQFITNNDQIIELY